MSSESPMCPVYKEYARVLGMVSRDQTLWPHHRFVAEYLKSAIDRKHFNRCVKYEVERKS